MPASYEILKVLPKNLLSFLCGLLSRILWPEPIAHWLKAWFVKAFGIDMSEAGSPLDSYPTLEAVFTRELKPGARPQGRGIVSPADGSLSYSLPLASAQAPLIQAKGFDYSPVELVYGTLQPAGGQELPKFAWFSTIYLAPHNYHRVHTPVAGRLCVMRYLPGDLWPVNELFVGLVPELFCRNERLVFEIAATGGGRAYVVMVGAFNVGRIATRYWPELVANGWQRQRRAPRACEKRLVCPVDLELGDELGVFMLGSTVVVVFDEILAKRYPLRPQDGKRPVRMGETLGIGS